MFEFRLLPTFARITQKADAAALMESLRTTLVIWGNLVQQSGKPAAEIARRLEVSTETLRVWVRQADIDAGRRVDGPSTEETEEVRRLRREVRVLLNAIGSPVFSRPVV